MVQNPCPSTLKCLHQTFPWVRLKQTYGLSELGIPQTRLRFQLSLDQSGGRGFEMVDGVLWIRAESAMLGYLNAPLPF